MCVCTCVYVCAHTCVSPHLIRIACKSMGMCVGGIIYLIQNSLPVTATPEKGSSLSSYYQLPVVLWGSHGASWWNADGPRAAHVQITQPLSVPGYNSYCQVQEAIFHHASFHPPVFSLQCSLNLGRGLQMSYLGLSSQESHILSTLTKYESLN